jgi:predicted nucleic acid-binding protein
LTRYADTSLLASLYLNDARVAESVALLRTFSIPVTVLGRIELFNALQLAVFRRQILATEAAALRATIEQDLASGVLRMTPLPAHVFERAEALVASHSAVLGARSLDVLHVATAVELGAGVFLTYDQRQAALARAAGLKVRPAGLGV